MLVLSRKANQSITIGSDIRILIVSVDRDEVKLGIEAPRHLAVYRSGPVGEAAAEADITRDADRP